ncbi:MAG TPA: response regulator transcription factor [Actinospica sp.]|jgi:DNA-binding NarL/FixJ family response regulator|nr:response regulator transcription factor [Actinospica sp.]
MRTQQVMQFAPTIPRPAAPAGSAVPVAVFGREAMFRAGVGTLLGAVPGLDVVGETEDAAGTAALLLRQPVTVLVVVCDTEHDVEVPGFLAWVRDHVPRCRVVALTGAAAREDAVFRLLRAGVRAVVDRAASPGELAAAVHAVAAGEAVLTPRITSRLLDRFAGIDLERCAQADTLVRKLSPREREVLDLVARGYGNAKIARALYLSQGAVKAIISRLLTKLKCQNRVQMACLAQAAELLG